MKRLISAIAFIAVFLMSAQATGAYSGGAGTADEPYQIANAADLLTLAEDTNDYNKYFIMTADIDLNPDLPGRQIFTTAVIAPDENDTEQEFQGTKFTGDFNGNGHKISNLTINTGIAGNDYLGLFGYVDEYIVKGEIRNLRMANVRVVGGDNSYYIGGLAGYSNGNIIDCHSTGIVTGGDSSYYIGGLAGYHGGINNCLISDCCSTVIVTGGDEARAIGGLVGCNGSEVSNSYSSGTIAGEVNSADIGGLAGVNDGHISDCHSTGDVTGSYLVGGLTGINGGVIRDCYSKSAVRGESDLGGLAGCNSGYIINSYSTGTIKCEDDFGGIGGLAGVNGGSISGCYSTGAVKGGHEQIGGLVGANWSGAIDNCYSTGKINSKHAIWEIGGFAGRNIDGSISKCYATGTISAPRAWGDIGGFVGRNWSDWSGIITGSYFRGSRPDNEPGEPLTNAQMKQQASFAGWDFAGETVFGTEDIWRIIEGVSFPKLSWQPTLEVTSCSVTAGSNNSDKISFSGTLETTDDLSYTQGEIEVALNPTDMNNLCIQTFPIDAKTLKNGIFSYSGTDDGVKKSFKYDVNSCRFSFSAGNIDLAGLSCPVNVRIDIGDFNTQAELDETIVNGKRTIPIELMMGVQNALRIDKIQVKQRKNPNSDQLTVKGGFAFADTDVNMVETDLKITLNGEPYTIEKSKMKANKNGFGCKNVVLEDGVSIGTVDFNFKTCTFKATIKNTEIDDLHGLVDFGIIIGADYDESAEVELP